MATKHCSAPQLFLTALLLSAILFLANAFALLGRLPPSKITSSFDSEIYHSLEVFELQYEEMEKNFRIYVYPYGDIDIYQDEPKGEYASEGYFFHNIRESQFRTHDAETAHLFFLPISFDNMQKQGIPFSNMTKVIQSYIEILAAEYDNWHGSWGTDHFFITCHDSGLKASEEVLLLAKHSIRVVCSPTYDAVYIPHKDVALPQIMHPFAHLAAENYLDNRKKLAFWGDHLNSTMRAMLEREWKDNTDLDVESRIISRKKAGYSAYEEEILRSKFCVCLHGSQGSSVHIADSIHYGCVPGPEAF